MTSGLISSSARQRVAEAAHFCCAYCQTSQRVVGPLLEIDHILPHARGGSDEESNLTLACPLCNSHKADRIEAMDLATNVRVRLFNPRMDVWAEHFEWTEDGTVIWGKTPIGRATVEALQMNEPDMVTVRRQWVMVGWHPPA